MDLAKIDEVSDSDLSVHSDRKKEIEIEIPLERRRIVQINEEEIIKKYQVKLANSTIFEGFVPSENHFDLDDRLLFRKINNRKTIKKARKSKGLAHSLMNEIIDLQEETKDDRDNEKLQKRRKARKAALDLDFIIKDEDRDTAKMEAIIEREFAKTAEQKYEDYKENKPIVPMTGGGINDVFQAVLQCFLCLDRFVKFFLKDEYLKPVRGTKKKKPVSTMLNQLFTRSTR